MLQFSQFHVYKQCDIVNRGLVSPERRRGLNIADMETLCPSFYFSNLNWLMQENKIINWTKEENKMFERALAIYDKQTPDRWQKVAAMIPGKSVSDVKRQYMELEADVSDIEAGLVPIPGYLASSFTLEMANCRAFDAFRKRPWTGRSSDQERKKGKPWTEDEHRRFLMGLERHGKGDWRNISRNFVISKTPTQVASHAQKFFMRQNSGGKDKRRPSIHDITSVHLTDSIPSGNNESLSPDKSTLAGQPHKPICPPKALLNWTHSDGAAMACNSTHGNAFLQYPHEMSSHDFKLHRGARLGAQSWASQLHVPNSKV